WGLNRDGQLGDNNPGYRASPMQVGTATTWTAAAASNSVGLDHTVALKNDGTLWAWGYNASGQLGDGMALGEAASMFTGRPNAAQVGTEANWTRIASGALNTVALKGDGTLWAWGNDGAGAISSSSPVQVGTATNW